LPKLIIEGSARHRARRDVKCGAWALRRKAHRYDYRVQPARI